MFTFTFLLILALVNIYYLQHYTSTLNYMSMRKLFKFNLIHEKSKELKQPSALKESEASSSTLKKNQVHSFSSLKINEDLSSAALEKIEQPTSTTTNFLLKRKIKLIKGRIKALSTNSNSSLYFKNHLPFCTISPNLGPLSTIDDSSTKVKDIETKFPEVCLGGWYSPSSCAPRHRVAIIVPYRNRERNLATFLNHMHPFLMKQKIEYGIYVIEQYGMGSFNRAKLFNVGFVEAQRLRAGGWQCFVFHDVDLLPLDERNLYSCPRQPRHMSVAVDVHDFKLLYSTLFGGVSALTVKQFISVNGFSNQFIGWGGEDDDMFKRIEFRNYFVSRYPMSIGRYKMLPHIKQEANPSRYILDTLYRGEKPHLKRKLDKACEAVGQKLVLHKSKRYFVLKSSEDYKWDGLSNLDYSLISVSYYRLYTHVTVNIDNYSASCDAYAHFSGKLLVCVTLMSYLLIFLQSIYNSPQ